MLAPPMEPVLDLSSPLRLHVGCGRARMAGWLNIDVQPLPGVDLVADVTQGLQVPDGAADVGGQQTGQFKVIVPECAPLLSTYNTP